MAAPDDASLATLLDAAAAAQGLSLDERARERLVAYVALVRKWGRIANLTGDTTPAVFTREQVADCLAVVPYAGRGRLLDIGSGNGLPGIVLAIAQPELEVTLLEPRAKRARFLTQARIELELANVAVVEGRVEDHHPTQSYDTLIARAVAALPALLTAARHLLHPEARLLAMKGHLAPSELALPGVAPTAVETHRLVVPGYAERHLVVVHGAGLASATSKGFVP